ncbi:MAG: IS1595 family transposase [Gammaproteobacteria bacterium]|nr:IS1595 family transposase [Gammaproteobacteria bacterium]
MEKYPENFDKLIDMFPSDEACLDYLSLIRWPDGYQCSRCSSCNSLKLSRGLYRCLSCKYESSVISGTLFQDTHKPLRLWFRAIWYVVNQKNGVSALGLQKALGLGSYRTAWNWLHKLRRTMVRPGRDKLSSIVEVNETLLGGKHPGKRGRGAAGKTIVLIAVEESRQGIGRIRCSDISNASADSLGQTVQQMVVAGSTIRTDGWRGYMSLTKLGYLHVPMNNSNIKESDSVQLAHRVASLLKRWLMGTHHGGINHQNLPYYLDEFTFRFNRRTSRSRGKLFYRLVQQAVQISPIPAKQLNTT